MSRRQDYRIKLDLPIWKKDGKLYYVEKEDLLLALARSPNSDAKIRRKMGWGYCHIAEALEGQRLNIWAVRHIEMGLRADITPAYVHPNFMTGS